MRKLLPILFLAVLFISCSDDDNGGNDDENKTIDKRILGRWKVEYSIYATSAIYNEETKEFTIGQYAKVFEYFGNFGEPDIVPQTGLFDMKEYQIEIKDDNTIYVHRVENTNTSVIYRVEDGYIKWNGNTLRYSIDNNELIIELLKIGDKYASSYSKSIYSKITE